jgi:3-methylcrotonyl-CoA carboxylase alpha subunit
MIAKLIVWGADRKQALARMRRALAQYRVVGVSNNINFLSRLVALPSFANAELDTGLIEREQGLLFPAQEAVPDEVWLVAALAELLHEQREVNAKSAAEAHRGSPWRALDGWRLNSRAERKLALRLQDTLQEVVVIVVPGAYRLALNGRSVRASGTLGRGGAVHAQLDDRRVNAAVVITGERRHVFYRGHSWPLALVDTLYVGGEGEDVEGGLRAPMPGKVVTLIAEPGVVVEKGAPLLVLEAMKMEHTITAPRKGKVVSFHVAAGDQVADGAELVEFEGAEA